MNNDQIEKMLDRLEAAQAIKEKEIDLLEAEKQLLFDAWMEITSLKATIEKMDRVLK